MKFYLTNVVIYDGSDAYVIKFVLQANDDGELTEESVKNVKTYLEGNGEILKIDVIQKMSLENIVECKDAYPEVFDRFNKMYF